jgi:hypothetical protein
MKYTRVTQTPPDKAARVDEIQLDEVFGPVRHVTYASILLLSTVILVAVSHSDRMERSLDFVTLFDYTKAIPDKNKAIAAINRAVTDSTWLNGPGEQDCLDMSKFGYPVVSFFPETDPTSPTCQISFSVKNGPGENQVQFEAIYSGVTIDCRPGTYPLSVNGGTGVVVNTPILTIVGGMGTTDATAPSLELSVGGSFGFDYANYNSVFSNCRDVRLSLANNILNATACEHPMSSPMCACIQAFTSRLTAWNGKLKGLPAPGVKLQDVLINGVERCVELRRTHDIRKPLERSYARSNVLFIFSLALFFNALYAMVVSRFKSILIHIGMLVTYFVVILLICLLNAGQDESMSNLGITIAIMVPAFLVIGTYGIILRFMTSYDEGRLSIPAPFLHPVTFDLCLCSLTLFTLVERGIVQSEYLIVEMLKCHAVAAIYIAITWFHRHGNDNNTGIFATEGVQQAYLTLMIVGISASLGPTVVPYPAKKCFEMHWLLPGAFTYLAFSNPAWAQSLRFGQKLQSTEDKYTYGFNEIAGVFSVMIGFTLWAYFLQDHLQVYGSSHFSYLPPSDPLAEVTMRVI